CGAPPQFATSRSYGLQHSVHCGFLPVLDGGRADEVQDLGILGTELRVDAVKFTAWQRSPEILRDGLRGTDVVVNLFARMQHEVFREYLQARSCCASGNLGQQLQ